MSKYFWFALFLLFCSSSLAAEDYSVVDYSKFSNRDALSEIYDLDPPEISDDGNIVVYRKFPYHPDDYPDANRTSWPVLFFAYNKTTNETTWINKGLNGELPGKRLSDQEFLPSLCGNGRYVVFSSNADNLTKDTQRNGSDIFRYDLLNRKLECLTCNADGGAYYSYPICNYSGEFVLFTDGVKVFLYDAELSQFDIVFEKMPDGLGGEQSKGYYYDLSGNGRYIAISAVAKDLPTYMVGSTERYREVCLRYDVEKKEFLRISGYEKISKKIIGCDYVQISDDGSKIMYTSKPYIKGQLEDHLAGIFLHDLDQAKDIWVSRKFDGKKVYYWANYTPRMSGDGRFIVYGGIRSSFFYDRTLFPYSLDRRGFQTFIFDSSNLSTRSFTQLSNGNFGRASAFEPAISGDGQWSALYGEALREPGGGLAKKGSYDAVLIGKLETPNPNRLELFDAPTVKYRSGIIDVSFNKVNGARIYDVELLSSGNLITRKRVKVPTARIKLGKVKKKISVRYSVYEYEEGQKPENDYVSYAQTVMVS